MEAMPPTPELDKLSKVSSQSQSIGEFLDWAARTKSAKLMTWVERDTEEFCTGGMFNGCDNGKQLSLGGDRNGRKCDKCGGTGTYTHHFEGYEPLSYSIETVLAEYFEIDLKKVEDERRAILARLS